MRMRQGRPFEVRVVQGGRAPQEATGTPQLPVGPLFLISGETVQDHGGGRHPRRPSKVLSVGTTNRRPGRRRRSGLRRAFGRRLNASAAEPALVPPVAD